MKTWRFHARIVAVSLCCWLVSTNAYAQYKNSLFELDVGGVYITRPSTQDSNGNPITNVNQLPDRLANGWRLGAEYALKMHSDHWWFVSHVSGYFLQFDPSSDIANSPDAEYDALAQSTIGTVFGPQGMVGVRYYLQTDKIRPYLHVGVSYMYLFNFGASGNTASISLFNNGGSNSNGSVYLPHTSIFAVHGQPGVEFILMRDFALNIFVSIEEWLIFNAANNTSFTYGAGMTFYD